MIEERDKAVLQDLARHAARAGITFYVIGAGARLLTHDWPCKLKGARSTTDWDVAVQVESWPEFERLKQALTEDGAPFRPTEIEHRLHHVQGRHLDIVPYGGVEASDRTVTYPKSATMHSTLGLRECSRCCERSDVGGPAPILVLGPPGLIVLKALAYGERRALKCSDLEDIDFIAGTYEDAVGLESALEQAGEAMRTKALRYEDMGAYLVARRIANLALPEEVLRPLRRLLEELADPSSRAVTDLVPPHVPDEIEERRRIQRRYAAFQLGLDGVPLQDPR